VAAAAQIIDDGHLMAGLDATVDHVRADEARAAGHEDLHDAALCWREQGVPRDF
jgi:hypothetical protein